MSVTGALRIVDIVGWLALAVFIGGVAFLTLLWPRGADVPRARRLIGGGLGFGIVSSLLGFGLAAAQLRAGGFDDAVKPAAWRAAIDVTLGRAWLARAIVWLLALVVVAALRGGADTVAGWPWRAGALAVALGLVRTTGLASHAAQSRHTAIGAWADAVHLTAISLWLGGLVMLGAVVLPRRQIDELRAIVPRYSLIALGSVTTVIVAGTVMGWDLVGSLHALFTSHYGHLLLLKLGVFVALMGAAYASKTWVQHRLDLAVVLRGDQATVRPFVISVGVETVLAVAVLSLASVLVTSSPVR